MHNYATNGKASLKVHNQFKPISYILIKLTHEEQVEK